MVVHVHSSIVTVKEMQAVLLCLSFILHMNQSSAAYKYTSCEQDKCWVGSCCVVLTLRHEQLKPYMAGVGVPDSYALTWKLEVVY